MLYLQQFTGFGVNQSIENAGADEISSLKKKTSVMYDEQMRANKEKD